MIVAKRLEVGLFELQRVATLAAVVVIRQPSARARLFAKLQEQGIKLDSIIKILEEKAEMLGSHDDTEADGDAAALAKEGGRSIAEQKAEIHEMVAQLRQLSSNSL